MFTFGQAINDIFSRERQFSEQRLQQARDLRMQAATLKLRNRLNSALEKVYESQAKGNTIQNDVTQATHDAMSTTNEEGKTVYQQQTALGLDEIKSSIDVNNASAGLANAQASGLTQTTEAYESNPNADPANLKEAEIQANIERVKAMSEGRSGGASSGGNGLGLDERMANSFFNALVDTSANAKESLDDITNIAAARTNSDDPEEVTRGQNQLKSLTQEYNNAILGQNALASKTGLPPTATALLVPEFNADGKFIGYRNQPITQQDIQGYIQSNQQMRAYFGQGAPAAAAPTTTQTDTTGVPATPKMNYQDLIKKNN